MLKPRIKTYLKTTGHVAFAKLKLNEKLNVKPSEVEQQIKDMTEDNQWYFDMGFHETMFLFHAGPGAMNHS